MRHAAVQLLCLGACVWSVAVADPPAATPSAPAPAATTAAASPAAKPAVDPDEKRLIAMGYKPEMRNGEKVFCQRIEEIGSRLSPRKECATIAELKARQVLEREQVENLQRLQSSQSGH